MKAVNKTRKTLGALNRWKRHVIAYQKMREQYKKQNMPFLSWGAEADAYSAMKQRQRESWNNLIIMRHIVENL